MDAGFVLYFTCEAIIRSLNWYRDNLKEDHRLFIYFSGHGFVDKDGIGYWLPHDVGKDVNTTGKMKDDEIINISAKKIFHYRIVKFLEKCKAKNIFVVADSCYAGEIFSEFKGGELPAQLIKEKSRQLLAAGSSVVPDPSPFTNFLIDFLNNNNQPYLLGSTIISNIFWDRQIFLKWKMPRINNYLEILFTSRCFRPIKRIF